MMRKCPCGRVVRWMDAWTCQACGAPCCPECAYRPEATIYCQDCADRSSWAEPALAGIAGLDVYGWKMQMEGVR
ncbi:MAG: hypothetical protein QN193_00575 [Armatimonadota bacterium]|nr:hypothetical protein [Armatimonadota bacterium]MDR7445170.1 hypothetical protein [Armatimonadota bacterium]MDR7569084.1 hypothetical protein [Armatimonadota bacterium]MDR7613973.1 hypothetical protein [Armatimonadota bacterium]